MVHFFFLFLFDKSFVDTFRLILIFFFNFIKELVFSIERRDNLTQKPIQYAWIPSMPLHLSFEPIAAHRQDFD
jgi:hypothetical protein